MKKILLFLSVTMMFSCTDPKRARKVLTQAGYTDIEIGGHDAFACGEEDDSCTEFYATGPSGHRVHGAVGCDVSGCGKACTIRIH